MKEKIKNWLRKDKKENKKQIKILLIGGAILSLYILFLKVIGEETDIGVVGGFFGGVLLAALYINARRFWWPILKWFRRGGAEDDGRGDYGIAKEEINKCNKDKK